MKQPEYLVLNPSFNQFKKVPLSEKYIDEPYQDIYTYEIRWRRVKKIFHKKILHDIEDITTIESYNLNLKN
jgi:hypothetical protein